MTLRLRALEQRDRPCMHRWENDQSAWVYSDNIAPLSERQVADYIANYDADPFRAGQLRLVLSDDDDAALGLLDLYDISAMHAHAFVGIYIDPDHRLQGLAQEGLKLLCDYAFRTLGLRTLCALVLPDNAASERLFASSGLSSPAQCLVGAAVAWAFLTLTSTSSLPLRQTKRDPEPFIPYKKHMYGRKTHNPRF